MTEVVADLDADVMQRAALIAAVEFDLNSQVLSVMDEDERRFHEDAILDAAIQEAREVLEKGEP